MQIGEAQKDMQDAYLGGGSGVLVSGLVWMAAGIYAMYGSKQDTFIVFFIAGIFIHPIGVLVDKLFGRRGSHVKENPLGYLAMESTAILLTGLFIIYSLSQTLLDWLFPIMLLIIGVRYLLFQTLFGMKIYWILGLALMAAGYIGMESNQPFHTFGIVGGVIEIVFSIVIILMDRSNYKLYRR